MDCGVGPVQRCGLLQRLRSVDKLARRHFCSESTGKLAELTTATGTEFEWVPVHRDVGQLAHHGVQK